MSKNRVANVRQAAAGGMIGAGLWLVLKFGMTLTEPAFASYAVVLAAAAALLYAVAKRARRGRRR